jgi:dihydropteroate synthase/dihydroneopterin aldolase
VNTDLRHATGALPTSHRPVVMGVLNVTPDSFSDGGRALDADGSPDRAIALGLAMVADGADCIDVGGESTRPGASPVTVDDECARVVPVVAGLVARGVVVSIDTRHAVVARAALDAGASLVNDVGALAPDDGMLAAVVGAGAGYVAMHLRGEPRTMQDDPRFEDVVAEVEAELRDTIAAARAAGIAPTRSPSTPASGSARRSSTTWRCSRRSRASPRSAHRCSSGRPASRSSDGSPASRARGPSGRFTRECRARGARRRSHPAGPRRRRDRRGARRPAGDRCGQERPEGQGMMMDRIELHGIEAFGHHGVLPHEQEFGQTFTVDVALELDLAPAGASDHLADTVDYGALSADLAAVVRDERYDLIERLATRLAEVCLDRPKVDAVTVTVHKPHAPVPVPLADVVVTVRRTR